MSASTPKQANAAQPKAAKGPRRAEDIAPNIPWLDHLLTAIFGFCVLALVFSFWDMDRGMFAYLGVSMVASVVMIAVVKRSSRYVGAMIDVNQQLRKPTNMHKFCDQSWQLFIHVAMTFSVYFLVRDEPWYKNSLWCWRDPLTYVDYDEVTKIIYSLALGIWIYTAFSHRFIEKKRKDYFVMYIHHIVTIVLLTFSYRFHQTRVGILVAFIHDASDITVDLLKVINYLQWEGPKFFFCVESIFAINLGSWVFFRFYWFADIISSAVQSWPAMTEARPDMIMGTTLLISLLGVLFLMHVYWFLLFLRLLWRIITQGAHTAGQHEYEGISGSEAEEVDAQAAKKNQ